MFYKPLLTALIILTNLVAFSVSQCGTDEQFFRGLVTIQTDDGFASQKELLQMVKARRLSMTSFANSDERRLNSPKYLSLDELKQMKSSYYFRLEFENHTKSHLRLTEICDPYDYTLMDEQTDHVYDMLRNDLYEKQRSFHYAAPFGSINECVRNYMINKSTVKSLRGVQRGLNAKNGDIWNLKAYSVDIRRSLSDFKGLIDQAIAERKWLQLYWHLMLDDCGSEIYCFPTSETAELLDYIKQKKNQYEIFVVSQDLGVNLMNADALYWDRLGLDTGDCEKIDSVVDFFSGRRLQYAEDEIGLEILLDETVNLNVPVSNEELIEEFYEDEYCYVTVVDDADTCFFFRFELNLPKDIPLQFLDGSNCQDPLYHSDKTTVLKYRCHFPNNELKTVDI